MKTPERLAIQWLYDNLSEHPQACMLTNPPKYPGNPVDAFLAGYAAGREANSHNFPGSSNENGLPDLQEQVEALNEYMSVAQGKIMALQNHVRFLISAIKNYSGNDEYLNKLKNSLLLFSTS